MEQSDDPVARAKAKFLVAVGLCAEACSESDEAYATYCKAATAKELACEAYEKAANELAAVRAAYAPE